MMSLHAEVVASILAAGLLGLACGWMISRVRGERRLRGAVAGWEARHAKLEGESRADVERLEERLETLGAEMSALVARDRDAEERLARSEAGAHKARADAIELTRSQAATQERLQRIIRQKDQAIMELEAHRSGPAPAPASTPVAATRPEPAGGPVRTRPVAARPRAEAGRADRDARAAGGRPTPPRAAPAMAGAPGAADASRGAPFGGPPGGDDSADASLDATELLDVAALRGAGEDAIDDTIVTRVRPGGSPGRPTGFDDTLDEDAATIAMARDDTLDATGDATVVLDEAQIRTARAVRRRH